MTSKLPSGTTDSRLAALEVGHEATRETLESLAQAVKDLSTEIKNLGNRRIPLGDWMTMMLVVMAVGGAVLGPIVQRLSSAEEAIRSHETRVAAGDQSNTAILEKLKEVETQFFWLGDVSNGERADNDRIVRMLWKRVYNDELPEKNVYQRGPARR